MGRSSSSKKNLTFGVEDKEAERDCTIDELDLSNRDSVSRESLLLNELNVYVKFVYCIEGTEEEVGVQVDGMSNTLYALPFIEDPKLVSKARPEFNSSYTKKYLEHWRKPFKLEDYEIYPHTSVWAARKQIGLILYRGYFECGFRFPIPSLTNSLLAY